MRSEGTYVCLSFLSVLPRRLDGSHGLGAAAEVMKVLVSNHLGLDEAPLEVAVNGPGSLRRQTPLLYGPASDLLLAGCQNQIQVCQCSSYHARAGQKQTGKVILQAELGKALSHDLFQLALDLALREEGLPRGGVVLQAVQLLLELDREWDDVAGDTAVLRDPLGDLGQILALLPEVVLHGEVDEVDHWLGGDELDLLIDQGDLGRCPRPISDWLVLLQHLFPSVSVDKIQTWGACA